MSDTTKSKLNIREIALRGTIMAAILTVPSIIAFLVSWVILDNLMTAAIVGGVIHFIAMGFA
ncbi:MAG: hypothetical protein OSA03_04750, partial [Nitrosopumilus sp.]|nr:hypothetical protein [Nitrosopumilus sp.]